MMQPNIASKPSSIYKTWPMINIVMGIFFALAAIVQINDPDVVLWLIVYCVPCFLSLTVAYTPEVTEKRWWTVVALIHVVICFVKSIFLLGQLIFWLQDRFINPLRYEEGRELAGVIIVMLWLIICKCHKNIKSGSPGCVALLMGLILMVGFLPLAFWGVCYILPLSHCEEMW